MCNNEKFYHVDFNHFSIHVLLAILYIVDNIHNVIWTKSLKQNILFYLYQCVTVLCTRSGEKLPVHVLFYVITNEGQGS